MGAPDPINPYQVVYSAAIEHRLRELSDEAIARGDGVAFTVALADFRRLRPIAYESQSYYRRITLSGDSPLFIRTQGVLAPPFFNFGKSSDAEARNRSLPCFFTQAITTISATSSWRGGGKQVIIRSQE